MRQVAGSGDPGAKLDQAKRVAFVHGSDSGGHRAVADAMAAVLEREPGVEVAVIDALENEPPIAAVQTALNRFSRRYALGFRRWLFDLVAKENPVVCWAARRLVRLKARGSDSFLDAIKRFGPDLVVSTHSQTNIMLADWDARGRLNVPIHSILSDYRAHPLWADSRIDRYYVASDAVKTELMAYGVPDGAIQVTGIPTGRGRSADGARASRELKQSLGLSPDLPLFLVLGGSLGLGELDKVVQVVDRSPAHFQVAVMAGQNQHVEEKLKRLASGMRHPLAVKGFVTNIPDWLAASDVIFTKPGGGTVTEILLQRKPFIVMEAPSGIERHALEPLVDARVACVARTTDELPGVLERLLSDGDLRARIERAEAALARPDAGTAIKESILRKVHNLSMV